VTKVQRQAPRFINQPISAEAWNDSDEISAIANESTELLKSLQDDRQKSRTANWWDRLYLGWRKEGARTFFRTFKGNSGAPHSAFANPDDDDALTADPRKVATLFRKEWSKVFTRDPTLPDELWSQFSAEYGKYITTISSLNTDPLTAAELAAQAKRTWNGSAAGLDGWKPAELKALPMPAWSARMRVEAMFVRTATLPKVYHQVPVTMLRKAEGLTPLQHRGISVFAATYRMVG